ncbi:uncharacterized protein L201_005500 [Kwoniella dendrophila CBS 6074]|uniref:SH3 domain-containing protein n=1 Tax=Kwoniella dendrophila CBS 6074 TaxID=1295534 RepID=A0AAX4K0C1_9TREE
MALPIGTARPAYSTQPTSTTIVSSTSYNSDYQSNATTLTSITVPDIDSPGIDNKKRRLEPILDVFEESSSIIEMADRYAEERPRRTSMDLSRGPSVRDRASQFEQSQQQQQQKYASSSKSNTNTPRGRPLPQPFDVDMGRTRSTSPLRISRKISSNLSTPNSNNSNQVRRIPVPPATAPLDRLSTQRRTYEFENAPNTSSPSDRLPQKTGKLERGSGSAKRMIQQWESLPSTPQSKQTFDSTSTNPGGDAGPSSIPMGVNGRLMSREYLDQKPLPIPRANQLPASAKFISNQAGPSNSFSINPYSPNKGTTLNPSPLQQQQQQHLRTPTQSNTAANRKRSATLSPTPSSWSISLSPNSPSGGVGGGEKRNKRNGHSPNTGGGRSPLKEMLNKFGGGIQAIKSKAKGKHKEKDKDKYFSRSPSSFGWGSSTENVDYLSEERLGTNGLPGGIVFSDRMGEEEMGSSSKGFSDPNVIRSSAAMYLIPTPCSSVSSWGSWLTSWAILTSNQLQITYCPIFQNPSSGNSTPKRVLSGTNPSNHSGLPSISFDQIPQPEKGTTCDVELEMKDCVEVRSLRRDEVKGRGIPPVPEGVGTEVLEMTWSDGSKRYIGVEGVAGRLGWVSAIWDVLLACKSTQPPALPPPSPLFPPTSLSRASTSHIPPFPPSVPIPSSPYSPSSRNGKVEQSEFQSRLRALEMRSSGSSLPPVQKIGDEWVAGSSLGIPTSDIDSLPLSLPNPNVDLIRQRSASPLGQPKQRADNIGLRDSVQRMFDLGPDLDLTLERPKSTSSSSRQSSEMSERIRAWQPSASPSTSGHDNSRRSFNRMNSNKSETSNTESKSLRLPYDDDNVTDIAAGGREYLKTETMLSFDPNDLNPSRSASQVRKPGPSLLIEQQSRRYGMVGYKNQEQNQLPILEENSTLTDQNNDNHNNDDDDAEVDTFLIKPGGAALTQISHVTFPKPAIGGIQMITQSSLPIIKSSGVSVTSRSSDETRPSTEEMIITPQSRPLSRLTNSTETGLTSISLIDPTPTVIATATAAKLENQSNDISSKIDHVQYDVQNIIANLGELIQDSKEPKEMVIPRELDDKLNLLGLDLKNIENSLQLNNLANTKHEDLDKFSSEEDKLLQVNVKLDNIVKLCEQVLSSKQSNHNIIPSVNTAAIIPAGSGSTDDRSNSPPTSRDTLTASPSEEEKSAGQEVAQIMADLTGGSSKNSPRLVGLQVLHNVSAPPSPKVESDSTLSPPPASHKSPIQDETDNNNKNSIGLPEETTKQVSQVLELVTELKEARTLQTQQTTDIARYLNELNSWLEKFVVNSSGELSNLSKRLNILVGSSADENPSGSSVNGETSSSSASVQSPNSGQPGLPDLVADLHSMMSEQKRRNDSEGLVGQRLDALLGMMGEERERASGQQNTVEQVVGILERQRQDNEMLLRAVATDLTTEIRGERMRFIEAMQQATSVNVSMHVEEFKKLLSTEVNKSMAELGQMREEKKVLEQQISDLFALMAKHGGKGKKNVQPTQQQMRIPPSPLGGIPHQLLASPIYGGSPGLQGQGQGRGLPLPPH